MKFFHIYILCFILFTTAISCGKTKELAVSNEEVINEVEETIVDVDTFDFKFIWIAPFYSEDDCGDSKCLLSRSCSKYSWENQAPILGFDYEIGFKYHIEVNANNELVKIWVKEKI